MEYNQYFPFVMFVMLTVNQFVGQGSGPLGWQKQDSHIFPKTGALPLICWKNQSCHYINNEV